MKRFLAVMVVMAAAFAVPALAGGYMGVSGGSVSVRSFCDGTAGLGISCDDSASGFRIFGGFAPAKNVALELGYVDLGKVGGSLGASSVSVSADGMDASAVFGIPLGARSAVFTRLGIYRLEERLASNVGLSGSARSTGMTFGVGLRFDPTERLGLRLEWQRYSDVGDASIGKSDVDFVSAGVLARF